MAVIRECQICEKTGKELKDETVVITNAGNEICWPCTADAVAFYIDAANEEA